MTLPSSNRQHSLVAQAQQGRRRRRRKDIIARAIATALPPFSVAGRYKLKNLLGGRAPSQPQGRRVEVVIAGSNKKLGILFLNDSNFHLPLRDVVGPVLKPHELAYDYDCRPVHGNRYTHWTLACTLSAQHGGEPICPSTIVRNARVGSKIVVCRRPNEWIRFWKLLCAPPSPDQVLGIFKTNVPWSRELLLFAAHHRNLEVYSAYLSANGRFCDDLECAMVGLNNDHTLYYSTPELHKNRDLMLAAVRINGKHLMFATPKHKADREIVLAAIRQDGVVLEWAAPELRADRTVVMVAVQTCSYDSLKFASPELQADRDVVMAAVRHKGSALKYASPELQADRDIVMAAVQEWGRAILYAAPSLQADRDIVMAASNTGQW